jgi:imidazolonepropionase-like amidohydrolase
MRTTFRTSLVAVAASVVAASAWFAVPVRGQMASRAPRYAIKDAKIVTVSGATIDKGTIVMRGGVIEDVGASVAVPSDAVVIDGAGLTVYPGLIDMANTALLEPETGAQPGRGGGGGGGRGAAGRAGGAPAGDTPSWADNERARREALLRADFDAARDVAVDGDAMRQIAAAGVTSALATPTQGLIRGQSALINVMAPPEAVEISQVAGYRRGAVVVRSGVAQHVGTGAGRAGGGGYPGALLGVIAFIRQSLYDAAWQKNAHAFADRHKDAPLPAFEPVLDALAPALDGKMPVAFEANQQREILRALALAKEFNLSPIIVGGAEAAGVVDDLKAAKARVIWATGQGNAGGRGGGGGAGGGGVQRGGVANPFTPQNGPRVPAELQKAGVPFAFGTAGAPAAELLRGAQRAVRLGNLPADAAIRALTIDAATIAGVAERLGSIDKGKMANVVVTDGDLLADNTRIRHVFVGGYPVDVTAVPAPAPAGRRGGGGGEGGRRR